MTYSQKVKEELCTAKFSCKKCGQAFVCGVLFCRDQYKNTLFQCDNKHIVELLAQKIVELTGIIASAKYDAENSRKKHPIFQLVLEQTEDIGTFYEQFQSILEWKMDPKCLEKSCCKAAFLRGAFLACGIIVNPAKEYHMEFKFHRQDVADWMENFVQTCGFGFKLSSRKGVPVLYGKDSALIEEVLTWMGASKSAMDLMDIKILKEVRNQVNRVINCETANIQKTIKASMKQVEDIRFLVQEKGMEYFPEDLREVAAARLENPELSLTDLAKEIPSGISRSGLNHRLARIGKMAEQLREEKNQEQHAG
ncbi:MAG: DNA-binding protein WhiA [Massiliimalia sp.]